MLAMAKLPGLPAACSHPLSHQLSHLRWPASHCGICADPQSHSAVHLQTHEAQHVVKCCQAAAQAAQVTFSSSCPATRLRAQEPGQSEAASTMTAQAESKPDSETDKGSQQVCKLPCDSPLSCVWGSRPLSAGSTDPFRSAPLVGT